MNVYLDIETIPQQPEEEARAAIAETISTPKTMSKPETVAQWHAGEGKYAGVKDAAIEEAYRKTALDGSKGEIFSIAWAVEDQEIMSISRTDISEDCSEHAVICDFFGRLAAQLDGRPSLFTGHNIAGFDLKFLYHRSVILGIRPLFKLPFNGRHEKDFYCTMAAWAGVRDRISQDNLCKALGIEGKPDDIDGSSIWDHVKAGNGERVEEYNRSDVNVVRNIHKRLNFI